jgi:lipopolysaccharide transport system ATP-binding protein
MNTVIKVENLSKQYRLGEVSTGALSHDINRWWHKMRGKEDPYLRIGEDNDRTTKGGSDYVWALKNVDFEVRQGEVMGIIGRNGAGKSTLLKILSRTTSPTKGELKIRGRVASLLEVGTGFHPELTGRDNVFLNGTIMGMTRKEIMQKFDAIVDFAGVERYIDTPVKRYSSGMYVRLAFAVAAHLEPEILIVDEVLAVGDAEFQKKCLGKMSEVSEKDGRTILFVSHNMTAVKNLCSTVMYMTNGSVHEIGPTNQVINSYLSHYVNSSLFQEYGSPEEAPGNQFVSVKKIEIVPKLKNETDPITIDKDVDIEFEFWNKVDGATLNLSLGIYTIADEHVCQVVSNPAILPKGLCKSVCRIPANFLNDGIYKITILIVQDQSKVLFEFSDTVSFEMHESREASGWHGKWPGFVRPQFNFNLAKF